MVRRAVFHPLFYNLSTSHLCLNFLTCKVKIRTPSHLPGQRWGASEMANVAAHKPNGCSRQGRTVKSLELCLKERPIGLGKDSPGGYGLTFLLIFGFLLGLHGCIILGHVDDIDVLPIADGLQQAEESGSCVPSKECLQAVKHHFSVEVTQLKPEHKQLLWPQDHLFSKKEATCSFAAAFTGAATGSADTEPLVLGPDESSTAFPPARFKGL